MVFALRVSCYSVHIIPFIYQKGFLIRQKQIIEKCKYYYSNIRIGVFVKYDTKADHLKHKPYS